LIKKQEQLKQQKNKMNLKNATILALLITILFGCKKKDDLIPDPTITVSSSEISLGSVDINTKYSLVLLKNGTGNISYTVSNDGSWYAINKNSGSLSTSSADTLKITPAFGAIKKGENSGVITIIPSINNKAGLPIKVNIKASYDAPKITLSANAIDLLTISDQSKGSFTLTPEGKGQINYKITSDVPWLSASKLSGSLLATETISILIDKKLLDDGANIGNLTIIPNINGVDDQPLKVKVSGNYAKITSLSNYKLTQNETWSGTVKIIGDLTVPVGIKLTLKPGTKVKFSQSTKKSNFNVDGTLVSNGTSDGLVYFMSDFTKPTESDWMGIAVDGNIQATYTVFANAFFALAVNQSSENKAIPTLSNCLFYNNVFGYVYFGQNDVSISKCTFKFSDGIGIYGNKGAFNVSECDFISNSFDDINVGGANKDISLSKINFDTSTTKALNNLSINDESTVIKNKIKADNCYALTKISKIPLDNVFEQTNKATSKLSGIGCGFTDRITQSVTKTTNRKALMAARKAVINKLIQ
jgi:Viral BACON domain